MKLSMVVIVVVMACRVLLWVFASVVIVVDLDLVVYLKWSFFIYILINKENFNNFKINIERLRQ